MKLWRLEPDAVEPEPVHESADEEYMYAEQDSDDRGNFDRFGGDTDMFTAYHCGVIDSDGEPSEVYSYDSAEENADDSEDDNSSQHCSSDENENENARECSSDDY